MARLTMISGLHRTNLTTSRGHSLVVVSGRVAVTDERPVRGGAVQNSRTGSGRRQPAA